MLVVNERSGSLDDELDADRGGQVHDDVALVHELVDDELVEHRAVDEAEVGVVAQVVEVAQAAGGQVVERDHAVAPGEQGLDQVRADEAGTAGDQIAPAHQGDARAPVEVPRARARVRGSA